MDENLNHTKSLRNNRKISLGGYYYDISNKINSDRNFSIKMCIRDRPLTPLQQEKYDQKPGGPMTPSQKFVQKLRENQLDTSTATIPTGEVKEDVYKRQVPDKVQGPRDHKEVQEHEQV